MKNTIAILASLVVLGAASSQAAVLGVVNYNNWDSFTVLGYQGTAVDLTKTFVQLEYSVAGSTGLAKTESGATTVAVDTAGGYFDAGTAYLSEAAAGATVDFKLYVWTGADSFGAAQYRDSVTWSQTVGSWKNDAQPPATPDNVALNIPRQLELQQVPEPSTIALGLLGAGALLIRRRK